MRLVAARLHELEPSARSIVLADDIRLCEEVLRLTARGEWAEMVIDADLVTKALDARGAQWWWDALHLELQVAETLDEVPPGFSLGASASSAVSRPRDALWTSTLVGGWRSAWGMSQHSMGGVQWLCEDGSRPRVWEIASSGDWVQLCERYGVLGRDGFVYPDWASVADDWDGVHLSMGGLLVTYDVELTTSKGATRLIGWDCESTCWLRPVLHSWSMFDDLRGGSRWR